MPPEPSPSLHPDVLDPDVLDPDVAEMASTLRLSIARLARLLRQQDESGLAPALTTALATIYREGPITLGRLAAQEQVAAPTVTKMVDRLERRGLIVRQPDQVDRRICRVEITDAGRTQLDSIRDRRTEWLATRLADLDPEDIRRLHAAVDVLEELTLPPVVPTTPPPSPTTENPR